MIAVILELGDDLALTSNMALAGDHVPPSLRQMLEKHGLFQGDPYRVLANQATAALTSPMAAIASSVFNNVQDIPPIVRDRRWRMSRFRRPICAGPSCLSAVIVRKLTSRRIKCVRPFCFLLSCRSRW